ncbi:class I SAM-dependent methyltransferase [Microbacterium sp. G2-8]|uniref:class I SAM-dependent methyltransferase n=1 Tax=Microbacterium sp. G2-8 TaxID=2842454 RepID=UPI001C8AA88A|nr:class I SAM-dependent methyltransferase [Microbacterium sp. G2-8]
MSSDLRVSAARSFESGADAYELYRPPYPGRMFDDIVEAAGDLWGGPLLEIGAGTGRATVELARRGASIEVVEPSQDMVDVLTRRLHDADVAESISVRQGVFEDVSPDESFPLAVAAQSFHWADPATRWSRLAQILGTRGRAFLFWNAWNLDPAHHDLPAITAVYGEHGPELPIGLPRDYVARMWADGEIERDPHVALVDRRSYEWSHSMSRDAYLGLLETISQYAIAPREERDALYGALAPLLGDVVHLQGATLMLVVARA